MAASADTQWFLPLILLAKSSVLNSSAGLPLLIVFLMALVLTALLHWSFPGGSAWGKYHTIAPLSTQRTPPGPRGLPLLGSMNLMLGLAHRRLAAAAASNRATRLMALSLGATRVVVSSDPEVAREILQSPSFADRPIKESAFGLMFHRAIGFAPYGLYWRSLRRIAANHLFSPRQIAASSPHRARIAAQIVASLDDGSERPVRVRHVLKRASLNNIMTSVFGQRYELDGEEREDVQELRSLVDEGYDLLGKLNWSDHLPLLGALDLQKIRSRCDRLVPKVNRFVGRIIEQHRADPTRDHQDFVDVLLSLRGNDSLTDSDMVAVLWEMVFRGTDTVAVLIEWTLARLTMHGEVQARVQEELYRVVGMHREVTELDLGQLTYLHAVLKEVLRMHPPGPLLSWARLATSDVVVDGKLIPRGTTAMVNMWAIMHDPRVWAKPDEFRPERFMEEEIPIFGSDLRIAPFGSGRRNCPGKGLAMDTVVFWVAVLVHEFEWLPSPEVDLSEVLGLSCEMAVPLTVGLKRRRPKNEKT
ncbi:hypothetical protein HPP92_022159 [Vanilla planifolia]|uniref:Cytochrome P450 n=1 Tax=Vanilla planifolia TaxID=51239 RepID=A0A835PV67_VANPL|nr:hypothetical protein HPP92_022159 [Vanilla planifolia]